MILHIAEIMEVYY